jgi:hypothetical protein
MQNMTWIERIIESIWRDEVASRHMYAVGSATACHSFLPAFAHGRTEPEQQGVTTR